LLKHAALPLPALPVPLLGWHRAHAAQGAMGCGASASSKYAASDAKEASEPSQSASEPAAPTSGNEAENVNVAETVPQVARSAGRWRTAIAPDLQVLDLENEAEETSAAGGGKKVVAKACESLSQAVQSGHLEEVMEQHKFEAEPPAQETKCESEAETEERSNSKASQRGGEGGVTELVTGMMVESVATGALDMVIEGIQEGVVVAVSAVVEVPSMLMEVLD